MPNPDYSRLLATLANSRKLDPKDAAYQTLVNLIKAVQANQADVTAQLAIINDVINQVTANSNDILNLTTAHYVTTRTEPNLVNEFNLGGLVTGILAQSVSGSVATPTNATIGSGLSLTGTTLSSTSQNDIIDLVMEFDNNAIKAWPTTEFTLVAAPGAGKYISPIHIDVEAKIQAKYTNIDVDAYINTHTKDWQADIFSYLVNGNTTGLTAVSDWLNVDNQTALWRHLPFQGNFTVLLANAWGIYGGLVDLGVAANQKLVSSFNNGSSSNLTGGHANNKVTYYITYKILTLS